MTPVDPGGRWYGDAKDDSARSGLAEKTVTATGSSPAFEVTDIETLEATATTAGVTGTTPSLTLALEVSDDGTNWSPKAPSFPALTGAGSASESYDIEAWAKARWAWTVTGTTPSFKLTVATKAKLSGNA